MCAEITAAYEAASESVDIVVDQAEEKFGILHFYYHSKNQPIAIHAFDSLSDGGFRVWPGSFEIHKKVAEIVAKYEEMSVHVCEICGALGILRTDLGWVQTLCDEHYQNLVERVKQWHEL